MSTSPKSKIIIGALTVGLGAIGVMFQNFTPHKSINEHDVSEIYMNTALSTALKTKAEKKDATDVAFHKGDDTDEAPQKERSPDSEAAAEAEESLPTPIE